MVKSDERDHRNWMGALAPFLCPLIVMIASLLSSPARALTCLLPVDGSDAVGRVYSIHPEDEKPRLVGAENGLFQIEDDRLLRVEGSDAAGRIYNIRPEGEKPRFVGAENGLFRIEDDRLVLFEGGDAAGRVYRLWPKSEKPRFVLARNGLFRIEDDRLVLFEGSDAAGRLFGIKLERQKPTYVDAHNGLFRIEDDRLVRVDGSDAAGRVYKLLPESENPRFVLATNGLFRMEDNRLVRVEGSDAAGTVFGIQPEGEEPRYVRAEYGLFRIEGDRLVRVGGDAAGHVFDIRPEGEKPRLVGARNGLFRIEDDRLVLFEGGDAAVRVFNIRPEGEKPRFVGARNGLFLIEDDRLSRVDGSDTAGLIVELWPESEKPRFVKAGNGLFRIEDDRLARVDVGEATGRVYKLWPESGKPRFARAENGLFRIENDRFVRFEGGDAAGRVDDIRPEGEKPRFVRVDKGFFQIVSSHIATLNEEASQTASVLRTSSHGLRWKVKSECFAVASVEFQVQLQGGQHHYPTNISTLGDSRLLVVASVPIEAADGGTVTANLQYRQNETGAWTDLENSQRILKVNWSAMDHMSNAIKRFGGWAAAVHALLFFGFLFAARRAAWSWKVLSDPVLNKTFLWFWFAMRHLPVLQRWALSRWFNAVGARLDHEPHVPLPLNGPGKKTLSSVDLVTALGPRRHIWVQGNTGMGKTALANNLAACWFAGPSAPKEESWTLMRAFRKYGYILVPIAVRDYASVPLPEPPENWIFELVERQLARGGLPIEDKRLLRGIVTSGSVVLLLDGANEVADGGAIQQFALRYPEVGLVVTSQTLPETDATHSFEVWRLPESIGAALSPLLRAWLKEKQADAIAAAVSSSPIRRDIRSGYDVRLLADLVASDTMSVTIPDSRMGLYNAMLARAKRSDGSDYPVADLCKVSWHAWATGVRHLTPGKTIVNALLEPLLEPGVRIVRSVDNVSFEFRHDQMRGYLAARWAALHEVSPVDLIESTEGIWRLGRSEQQTVWGFLAELIDHERGRKLLEWSTLTAERAELQVSLRQIARRDRW